MGLSSDDLLTIGGHFYSHFYFNVYPLEGRRDQDPGYAIERLSTLHRLSSRAYSATGEDIVSG